VSNFPKNILFFCYPFLTNFSRAKSPYKKRAYGIHDVIQTPNKRNELDGQLCRSQLATRSVCFQDFSTGKYSFQVDSHEKIAFFINANHTFYLRPFSVSCKLEFNFRDGCRLAVNWSLTSAVSLRQWHPAKRASDRIKSPTVLCLTPFLRQSYKI